MISAYFFILALQAAAGTNEPDKSARDSFGLSLIETAAQRGDLDALRAMELQAKDLNVAGPTGHTPLFWAVEAQKNRKKVVEFLLSKGADPDFSTGYSPPCPLEFAVAQGDWEVIRVLLDSGADVNGFGGRPFLAAVNSRNIRLMEFLLKRGAKVDPKLPFAGSPLLYIVRGPHRIDTPSSPEEIRIYDRDFLPVVKFLIGNGANKDAQDLGESVLFQAEHRGLISIATYLRKVGATSNSAK